MRSVIILSSFYLFGISGFSQTSIDSAVMNYLKNVPGVPSPILQVTKTKKKTYRSANYFIEATDSIRHQDLMVKTFLFGSSTSHTKKYFLLEVNSNGVVNYRIIDNSNIEDAVKALLLHVQRWDLSDAEKSVLIRELTYAYN